MFYCSEVWIGKYPILFEDTILLPIYTFICASDTMERYYTMCYMWGNITLLFNHLNLLQNTFSQEEQVGLMHLELQDSWVGILMQVGCRAILI